MTQYPRSDFLGKSDQPRNRKLGLLFNYVDASFGMSTGSDEYQSGNAHAYLLSASPAPLGILMSLCSSDSATGSWARGKLLYGGKR